MLPEQGAGQEECVYCREFFPAPVEMHHHESDCDGLLDTRIVVAREALRDAEIASLAALDDVARKHDELLTLEREKEVPRV